MRNILIHGYFIVDYDALWTVIERDLGPLRGAVTSVLDGELGSA